MNMKRASKLTMIKILREFIKEISIMKIWSLSKILKNERPHWFNNQVRINTFLPPYPSEAFNRFIKIVVGHKRSAYQIYIAVISVCPYKCPHCSYGKRVSSKLSTEKMLGLIGDIKSLGTAILGFTGGEPMLRDDLEELIKAAGPEVFTIVFSTGHGLNLTRAKSLADAGVGCVTIGIESADPKKHDMVRGKSGSFKEGINAIKACKEAGIYTAIGTIGTKERIKDGELEEIYALGRKLEIGEIRLLSPGPSGSWIGHNEAVLSKEEYQILKDFHIKHNTQNNGPVVSSFAYLESAEMFGCNAGYNHLFIDASGEVCPCDLTPLSFGNIIKEPLKDIWDRMGEFFPRPCQNCIMHTIYKNIKSDILPLKPEQSKKIIKPVDKNAPLPELYRILFK